MAGWLATHQGVSLSEVKVKRYKRKLSTNSRSSKIYKDYQLAVLMSNVILIIISVCSLTSGGFVGWLVGSCTSELRKACGRPNFPKCCCKAGIFPQVGLFGHLFVWPTQRRIGHKLNPSGAWNWSLKCAAETLRKHHLRHLRSAQSAPVTLLHLANQKPEGIAAINKKYSVAISAQCRFQSCSELLGALSQSSKASTKMIQFSP